MVTGQAWKLTYTDSNGNEQIIAELGQNTGAERIDRLRYILKQKNPWILKVFADPSVLKAFPNEVSEFQSSEPEILFQEDDGTGFTTRGRFYSASQTQEDNEFAIRLLDFYHKLMKQPVTASSSDDIVDALTQSLPSGYVVDVPPEADVSGGYPTVDSWSVNNVQRRKAFRELTRNYNWSLFFLPEQDGNGDWKVRFEPDGFGGSVDSLDTSTDKITIKQWKPPRKKNLITKTFVEGVDSNGTKITSTKENTTIRDKYLGTNASDHNFQSFKVGYVESQSEADKIAENRLKPGPDATTVKDSGMISNIIYPQDVVNDSFTLVDDFRGIDDTFTCVKQENFYPANTSYIYLEFESEELEKAAEGEENLRDERARLFPESQTDVGNQNLNGNTDTAQADNSTQEDNQSPLVDGDTGTQDSDGNYNFNDFGPAGFLSPQTVSSSVPSVTEGVDFYLVSVNITLEDNDSDNSIDVKIENTDQNKVLFDETLTIGMPSSGVVNRSFTVIEASDDELDEIELEISNYDGDGGILEIAVDAIAQHTHSAINNGGTLEAADHDHNVDVNDAGHGDTTDPSTHNLDGSTDTKNVNVATEDKTDR